MSNGFAGDSFTVLTNPRSREAPMQVMKAATVSDSVRQASVVAPSGCRRRSSSRRVSFSQREHVDGSQRSIEADRATTWREPRGTASEIPTATIERIL